MPMELHDFRRRPQTRTGGPVSPGGALAAPLLAALLAASGCQGAIGDGAVQPELVVDSRTPGKPGPRTPGMPGQPANGGDAPPPGATLIGEPAAAPLARLNVAEYRNAMRDLFGVAADPARFAAAMKRIDDLPPDGRAHGFDNLGEALTLSDLHLELYVDLAAAFVSAALDGGSGAARARVLPCEPKGPTDAVCVRQIVARFARRAWRRPLAEEEIGRLVSVFEQAPSGDAAAALRATLQAVLVSPHFLFKVEPSSPAEVRWLESHQLAARLSFLLWSSLPDDELSAVADSRKLLEAGELSRQVRRMLGDERARALVENFAGQWLGLRSFDVAAPDAALFPVFDEPLRAAMRTETEAFLEDAFRNDRPLEELLTARHTFLDARLAQHYGLAAPASSGRVNLPASSGRAGVLTQGSLLTATSLPDRTSPVERGKWVLGQLLCSAPPPPPDELDIPELEGEGSAELSVRAQLEHHRASPACAGCHLEMDPIGLGLEHFDAIGRYRDRYGGGKHPVDARGVLPGGVGFDGAGELAQVLARDPRFKSCSVRQVLTYAFGRGLERGDEPLVAALVSRFEAGLRFGALLDAVVASKPFRALAAEQ